MNYGIEKYFNWISLRILRVHILRSSINDTDDLTSASMCIWVCVCMMYMLVFVLARACVCSGGVCMSKEVIFWHSSV